MRQFDPFARACEHDQMITDHRAAAQRGESDRPFRTRAGESGAVGDADLAQRDRTPGRGCLAQHQRSARGRVHFLAVMHLSDLDIPVGAEPRRRLTHQSREQHDAERGIAGLEHRDLARRVFDQRMVRRRQPGGADHDRRTCGARCGKMRFERGRRGEIDQRIGGGGEHRRVVAGIGAARELDALFRQYVADRHAHPAEAAIDTNATHRCCLAGDGADCNKGFGDRRIAGGRLFACRDHEPRQISTMLLRLLALTGTCLTVAAADPAPNQLYEDVRILAADDMTGRLVGTAGSASARAYLSERLRAIGVEPVLAGFEQPFEAEHKGEVLKGTKPDRPYPRIGHQRPGAADRRTLRSFRRSRRQGVQRRRRQCIRRRRAVVDRRTFRARAARPRYRLRAVGCRGAGFLRIDGVREGSAGYAVAHRDEPQSRHDEPQRPQRAMAGRRVSFAVPARPFRGDRRTGTGVAQAGA
ncbi:hypothetical protein DdX_21042 [Ditylenchus destructor]|uniref:Uncharacterized protein n=1 Tax=Ditylenchus destructor TaxID=166010 RepID=A0AAD4MFK3_9BILA|nr:hypothetical protein DdX_21042 [Ditylenchus destructor]